MKLPTCLRNLFTGVALALALGATAASANAPSLRVQFTLHESEAGATGVLIVALWDSTESYLKGDPPYSTTIEVDAFPDEVVFHNLPPGTYAISAFLDENRNQDLDTSPFGIPREPFGFSNNARNRFGPADFEDARFELTSDTTTLQEIQLR